MNSKNLSTAHHNYNNNKNNDNNALSQALTSPLLFFYPWCTGA
jgi:hypothetical protein